MAAAAGRFLQRRITSLSGRNLPLQFRGQQGYIYSQFVKGTRSVSTKTESSPTVSEEEQDSKSRHDDSKLTPNSIKVTSAVNEDNNVQYKAFSKLKTSTRHDLAMIFTCKVCETRLVKTVCRESYEKGVVVACCSGCNNLHLIADHLGWFGKPGSIEDFLAARGEEVKKGSVDTLNLTLEDLAGSKSS
ncbi:DNL-type zinc finger protein-like [Zingiber officinale]|uniref:DNL-type domain-containing protein n=1 Tax=Zingiber officinale TaxID=94328 RepID=A0A8J5I489_ZINOF|nr:DNL-type zinc finger protein-like [Zingiber officinale]KAG6533511.1 hypothetical protein ZIOFF_007386 [Zingiber officinale]